MSDGTISRMRQGSRWPGFAAGAGISALAGGGLGIAMIAFGMPGSALAAATAESTNPTVFKGFGNNKDPIQIEADNMGVATSDQLVTFTGSVFVRQKDANLVTQVLKVFYENAQPTGAQPAQAQTEAAGAPNSQLRRFEASGGLKITEPDQTVVGDSGWFDIASQKAEVDGHVVLTQAKNVARGSKLLINLKTGEYRLEGGSGGKDGAPGRIQLLISPTAKDGVAPPVKQK